MNNILSIIGIIACVSFIIYNIVEIVLAQRLYKKMEKENKDFYEKLINEYVNKTLGDD